MKQSTGRLQGARVFSREAALGVAAAVVAGLAACGGHNDNTCHNLPQAFGLFGQTNFNLGTANTKGAAAGTLNSPVGAVAVDGSTVYVADTANHRILGYPTPTAISGGASFVIGQADFTTTSSGVSASQFAYPTKVAIGNSGSSTLMAVADSGNNRVLIWKSVPTANTPADIVLGQPDFTHNDINYPSGSISASSLSNPTSVAVANGFIVVADKGNNRVLIWKGIPTSNNTPATFELGQTASTTSGTVDCTDNTQYCFTTGAAGSDKFPQGASTWTLAMNQPSDVWTNGTKLLVVDTNNQRVLAWNAIPNVNNLLAAGLIGFTQFGSTSQSGGAGSQALHSPTSVSSDGSAVFVADSVNNRVLEYVSYLSSTPLGPAATYVFGQQDFNSSHITANDPDQNGSIGDQRNDPATNGITAGTMFNPQGVLVTSNNQLFVTDTANSRVLLYTTSNTDGTPTGVDGSNTSDSSHCF
jgi:hypothetical protein